MKNMERIDADELAEHTGLYIEKVQAGETIEVAKGGSIVARLVPVPSPDALLSTEIAEGRVIPATLDWSDIPPPVEAGPSDVSVADELIRMREEERY